MGVLRTVMDVGQSISPTGHMVGSAGYGAAFMLLAAILLLAALLLGMQFRQTPHQYHA